jgi:hypothetical protein
MKIKENTKGYDFPVLISIYHERRVYLIFKLRDIKETTSEILKTQIYIKQNKTIN